MQGTTVLKLQESHVYGSSEMCVYFRFSAPTPILPTATAMQQQQTPQPRWPVHTAANRGRLPASAKSGPLFAAEVPVGTAQIRARVYSVPSPAARSGLADITLPPGLTQIGIDAFEGCSGLAEITLPPGLTQIGALAFSGCSGLAEIHPRARAHQHR